MEPEDNKQIVEVAAQEPVAEPTKKRSVGDILKLLATSYAKGDISRDQINSIRRELGISKNFFTKPKISETKKKHKRAISKASRKKNRGLGKGQKHNNGSFD